MCVAGQQANAFEAVRVLDVYSLRPCQLCPTHKEPTEVGKGVPLEKKQVLPAGLIDGNAAEQPFFMDVINFSDCICSCPG